MTRTMNTRTPTFNQKGKGDFHTCTSSYNDVVRIPPVRILHRPLNPVYGRYSWWNCNRTDSRAEDS